MQTVEEHITTIQKEEQDTLVTLKVILKYWKKESKHLRLTISEAMCSDAETFLKNITKHLNIKKEHCLEEVWIMQEAKEYEKRITWIEQIHGRIKIDVPDSYKAMLISQPNNLYEDPHYIEKKE